MKVGGVDGGVCCVGDGGRDAIGAPGALGAPGASAKVVDSSFF